MKKTLTVLLALVLVIAMSVAGTMAFLTSTDSVENTFTVGKVQITLDEAKVDEYGTLVQGANRTDKNAYTLIPGHPYTKDPSVHVNADSENSWVFVKVENGISAYEATDANYTPITTQITNNEWLPLNGVDNVYYQSYTKGQLDKDLEVFANFKISGTANKVDGWEAISAATTKITVTAYAIQKDGFDTPAAAWAELNRTTT